MNIQCSPKSVSLLGIANPIQYNDGMNSQSVGKTFLLVCSALVAIGSLIRIYYAQEPLWIDELHTGWVISGSINDVVPRSAIGNQTPLYYFVVRLLASLFGTTEWVIRTPSLVFSAASIALGQFIVWKLTKDRVATLSTGLILSLESLSIFWASEARPYAMLQFFAMLQTYVLLEQLCTLNRNRLFDFKLLLLTALLPLVHLTAMLQIFGQLIFLMILKYLKRDVTCASISLAAGLLVSVFVLPIVAQAFQKRSDWNSFSDTGAFIQQILPILVIAAAALLFTYSANKKASPSTIQSSAWVWIFSGSFPVAVAMLLGIAEWLPIESPRYVAISFVLLPVGLGISISKLGLNSFLKFVTIATLAIGPNPIAHSLISNGSIPSFRTENWHSAVDQIDQSINKDETLFLFSNLIEDHRLNTELPRKEIEYLKFPVSGIYKLSKRIHVVPMPTFAANRWNNEHISQIKSFGSAKILARVRPDDYDLIISELTSLANKLKLPIRIQSEFQEGNVLRVGHITVSPTK